MPKRKVSAYLITGGRFHDTDFARLEILKLLADRHHIRTEVGNDFVDIAAITAADLLITYTCDVQPTAEQTEHIRSWLARGGRWFALHGTNSVLRLLDDGNCTCPDDVAPKFFELLGTQFKAHPPIGRYLVSVSDPHHPLVAGIEPFETVDELYLSKPTAEIHLLLETRFQGEAPGFVDNIHWPEDVPQPVLYLRRVGEGAILYLTLGHCRGHYDLQPMVAFNPIVERCSWNLPVYYELLRRGIDWADPASTSQEDC